jgi:hypothetical protein
LRRFVFAVVLLLISLPAAAQRWEFQNNFWVSLHQTLLATAQRDLDLPIPDDERKQWMAAVNAYRIRFGTRAPWVDEELIRINDALTSTLDVLPPSIGEDLTTVLTSAAPIYRQRLWPSDERASRFWINVARSLITDAGEELAAEHGRIYGVTYPQRIRVDVAPYAGENGAYTTASNGLVHTTISSREPAYQGFAALEMLLHEGSHAIVGPTNGAIGPQINADAQTAGLLAPRQLWHALLFYTSGELTKRALRARGVPDYVPFAYRNQMYDRAFRGLQRPLETHWQQYLNGAMTREVAITNVVQATGIPPIPRVP